MQNKAASDDVAPERRHFAFMALTQERLDFRLHIKVCKRNASRFEAPACRMNEQVKNDNEFWNFSAGAAGFGPSYRLRLKIVYIGKACLRS
jgi:hypothetical protein